MATEQRRPHAANRWIVLGGGVFVGLMAAVIAVSGSFEETWATRTFVFALVVAFPAAMVVAWPRLTRSR